MSFKRFGEWLITERGKSFSMGVATTITLTLFGVKALPNTMFINQYKEIVHLYKDGMIVKLSDTLTQRFEKALDLVNVDEKKRKLYKPFAVFGFDTFHAGSTYSKFGAVIGMPVNFTYTDVDLIDKSQIKVNHESVSWDLPEGKALLDSYVLSENAQLYAIAREIKTADSAKFVFDSMNSVIMPAFCYSLSSILNEKLNLLIRPRQIRFVMYGLIFLFSGTLYLFTKDFMQIHYEKSVDHFLKAKDPIFVEGGKEYYAKILQRNRAIRKLLGKEGESMFSVTGNENFLLRQKHVPLVHRKEFFESQAEPM